ncbi:hypothetical protein HYR54_12675 [Candidatus Acetothermia bacterium]|nr:hypothetical protein [Candidatus Acetothermia bacterium]
MLNCASLGGGGTPSGWVDDGTVVRLADATDKVGIGTTGPQNLLTIGPNPSAASNANELLQLAKNEDAYMTIRDGTATALLGTTSGLPFVGSQSNHDFTIRTNNAEKVRITTSGNVGIGTISPNTRLEVQGPDTNLDTKAFKVSNSIGFAGLIVWDDGTVQIGTLVDNPKTQHACLTLGLYFATCSSAAEYVPTVDEGQGYPIAGDLVSIAPTLKNPYSDDHGPFVVAKTNKPCDENLIGFILDPKLGADGKKLNEHYMPLGIYGYFPAKVTMENGPIKRGDPITSSSKPGYGMKATQACKIIGYALEDADKEGTIQVFAHLSENAAPEVTALRAKVSELEQARAQENEEFRKRIETLEKIVARLTAK